jgi:hypothetical protein
MTETNIRDLAVAYRGLVLWFGAQLVLNCGAGGLNAAEPTPMAALLGLVLLAGMLATIGALGYYGYRTALALGSGTPWAWGLAMFIPCANAITLLILSHRATRACNAKGVPVGLLGPKMDSLQNGPGAGGRAG